MPHRTSGQPIISVIEESQARTIAELGYDLNDPHLKDSPLRIARFLSSWHTNRKERPTLTTFPNKEGYDEMVVVSGIQFYSLCAHHGVPFFGFATIGYIPKRDILGLSKFARIVDHYANQFQTQERLTAQIVESLAYALKPRGIGAVLTAEHLCMSMRGIRKPGHKTTTSDLRGAMHTKAATRAEFLALARRS